MTLFHFSLHKSGQRVGQQERKLQNQDIVSFFSQKKGSHRVWRLPAERKLQSQVQDIVTMSMFSKKK